MKNKVIIDELNRLIDEVGCLEKEIEPELTNGEDSGAYHFTEGLRQKIIILKGKIEDVGNNADKKILEIA